MKRITFSLLFAIGICWGVYAQQKISAFEVDLKSKGASIAPDMWGLFFEDINFAADGGLYAEMIKNYSFEFPSPFMGWQRIQEQGAMGYHYTKPHLDESKNKKFLQMQRLNEEGVFGMSNAGFRGMAVKANANYRLTFMARIAKGENLSLKAQLAKGRNILADVNIEGLTRDWQEYEVMLTASETADQVNFKILLEGEGELDIDMISLFPEDTWKGRKRGLRKDIVQLLADMNPGFLRFPGGCIVEGFDLENRYQWKNTIGEMKDRGTMINRWNIEFAHRNAPDYFQSFGLGFFEYFQLAEDLGAEPLPILSCGLACQYNSGEIVPLDMLDEYVQDALDLIEFANGSVETAWGAKRAAMGHPEPFDLKYIGVGNENWGPQYIERADVFEKAIKSAYPEMIIVSTSGPSPDGHEFDYLWKELTARNAELIDEHYYKSPEWFLESARRYDNYDRNGPKVFAGEYAAHSTTEKDALKKNNWEAALSEAAFMTGLERNADIVRLASYAPLLAHVDGWQWAPDMIWFDNLGVYATPNYYVQKLFSTNPGTHTATITANGNTVAGEDGMYASATIDEKAKEIIFKIVNTNAEIRAFDIKFSGNVKGKNATWIELQSDQLDVAHSLKEPKKIAPEEKSVEIQKRVVKTELKPYSVNVFRVKL
ncbi:alpha-L-arabinofuranosidase [Belliella sp. DSM 111904]|uniref:non-reducing end alpha-L-arabinofuranosidase n=1 Tax=Belliella filtrata TaxID=2923435 RepID=A0ABS9V2C6_9BACT|nr:alpha-L-arabinofuranosidase C-terminal domain-containing protein [Belliella filtrata]MCH7410526.1 alpha-L-arabinofuranosidase [Belliella filtrata]